MNCELFEENLGAFALGALPEDEMREAEKHLRTCANHPEAGELAMVGASLAVSAPEMDPPAALKARLMDAIHADVAGSSGAGASVEVADSPGLMERITGWFSGSRRGYALAGALGVIVAAVLIWNVSIQSDSASDNGGETVVALSGAASGQVVYTPDDQTAVMEVEGLEPAPEGHVYQVWAISDGAAASLGVLEVVEGSATAAMKGISLDGVVSIAVTVEPTPGSEQPTTEPIITGEV